MPENDFRAQIDELKRKLRDPLRLRLLVAALALVTGYLAIYQPLDSRIAAARRQLREEEQRAKLAQDVELLRAQHEAVVPRLQAGADLNEWIQYVLQGVRAQPVKLVNLDVEEQRRVGPYCALAMQLHVTGEMQHLDQLLQWFESNERLFRIDRLTLEPSRTHSQQRSLQLTLLALKA